MCEFNYLTNCSDVTRTGEIMIGTDQRSNMTTYQKAYLNVSKLSVLLRKPEDGYFLISQTEQLIMSM